jgi:hypothetical protein
MTSPQSALLIARFKALSIQTDCPLSIRQERSSKQEALRRMDRRVLRQSSLVQLPHRSHLNEMIGFDMFDKVLFHLRMFHFG